MNNSPTIRQWYVAKVLSPVRIAMPSVLLYHYMDDILVATQHHEVMEEAVALVTAAVNSAGLCIAPEKIQKNTTMEVLRLAHQGSNYSSSTLTDTDKHSKLA